MDFLIVIYIGCIKLWLVVGNWFVVYIEIFFVVSLLLFHVGWITEPCFPKVFDYSDP